MEVHRQHFRACENCLTTRLMIMMTFVEVICCSISQYARRRHLHSTGLQLYCSHAMCLDHRNICIHTPTKPATDSSTFANEDVASEWWKPKLRHVIMIGSSRISLPDWTCVACASWASVSSTAHGRHAWTHTIVLRAPSKRGAASPGMHMHGQPNAVH